MLMPTTEQSDVALSLERGAGDQVRGMLRDERPLTKSNRDFAWQAHHFVQQPRLTGPLPCLANAQRIEPREQFVQPQVGSRRRRQPGVQRQ